MTTSGAEECCPRFDPEPWDEQELQWRDKRFVKDRVRSFLHIPLNFGGVMRRICQLVDAAEARPNELLVLADENSLWGADVYVATSKEVSGAENVTLSGTFLAKVFDGPYRNVKNWIPETKSWVEARGKRVEKLYSFYTTCPKCAKKYGKNYVVIVAQV